MGDFTRIGDKVVHKNVVAELVSGIDDFVPLYKGVYDDATEYDLNDICSYQNKIYWHIGSTPTTGTAPIDTDVWSVFTNNIDITVTNEKLNIIK